MKSSLNILKILQIVAVPVIVLNVLTASIFFAFLSRSESKSFNFVWQQISDIVEGQANYLAQELFLDQEKAYEIRIRNISSAISLNGYEVCMDVNFIKRNRIFLGNCDISNTEFKFQSKKIEVAGESLATIIFGVKKKGMLSTFISVLAPSILISFFVGIVFLVMVSAWVYRKIVLPLMEEISEREAEVAMSKAMENTIYRIAHDVRSPIVMILKMTKRAASLPESRRLEYLQKNFKRVDKKLIEVNQMFKDMLHLSPDKKNTDVRQHKITDFMNDLHEDFPKVKFSYDSNQLAEFDYFKIKRVFENILNNAIEISDKSATVWINSYLVNSVWKIEIGNTGSAIDKENVKKIFHSYYSLRINSRGRGLGTSIAKKFVEDHDGKIWCESNGYDSQGKTIQARYRYNYVIFHIEIPVEEVSL